MLRNDLRLDHSTRIFLTGSCFAQNIGTYLTSANFRAVIDPLGMVFNPLALVDRYQVLLKTKERPELLSNNEKWHSFMVHSSLSGEDKNTTAETIGFAMERAESELLQSNLLILTWGTAYGYRHIGMNRIVSNCHRFPQEDFKKELISVETVVTSTIELFDLIRKRNPAIQFLITVSPVRHWKDGAVANSRSKAILIESAHRLVDLGYARYFPAYELLMDDLRDYRYYNADMLHPSPTAIEYVWQKFTETYMDTGTIDLADELMRLSRSLDHKFMGASKNQKSDFLKTMEDRIRSLEERLPEMDFSGYRIKLNRLLQK